MVSYITDQYENVDAKDGGAVVLVGGGALGPANVLPGLWSAEVSHGLDRVPTATVRIAKPPASVVYGARLRVGFGFNQNYEGDFTGIVLNVNRDQDGCTIEAVGQSWPLEIPFHKVVATLNNIDSTDAVEALLLEAGVAGTVLLPAWQIGTVVPQTLEFSTYSEAILKILEVEGAHWFEDASGGVQVRLVDLAPSLTVVRTYFSMNLTGITESYPTGITTGRPRLRQVSKVQAAREVKNQVFVHGATVDTTESDGSVTSADIESSGSAPSPYVLKPDGTQAYNDFLFNNELIDTQAKADEVVVRYLQILNRLQERTSITIDGDPRLNLATTVGIEDPDYTEVTGRWILESYQTSFNQSDFSSTLNLRTGGASANTAPVAAFDVTVEREVINDRVYVVVTFDASSSYDPDGTIVTYAWSDDQSPDIATGSDPVFTVMVDPATIVGTWHVQLDITDDSGTITSLSKIVNIAAGTVGVNIPAFFTAFANRFSATPDGGQTWNDQVGTGVISVDAAPGSINLPGCALFGTTAGAIFRTLNYCATAPTQVMAAVGSPIVDIYWEATGTGQLVWAITQDGRVFYSINRGVTWGLHVNLTVLFGRVCVLNRIDSFTLGGQIFVRVYGGERVSSTKSLPLIAYSPISAPGWRRVTLGGELLSDLASSVSNDLIVADGAYKNAESLAIILNSGLFTPAVYYSQVWPIPSYWRRATGLPAGKSQGRWIAPDLELNKFVFQFENREVYLGDVSGTPGVMAVTQAAAALDLNESPNHGLWLGQSVPGLSGVYLVAAESALTNGTVYKTTDRFATIGKVRPATGFPAAVAGMDAKMVAVGPPSLGGALTARIAIVHDVGGATTWDISYPSSSSFTTWTNTALPAEVTHERPRPICITKNLWFVLNAGGFPDPTDKSFGDECNRQIARTQDGGATWDTIAVGDETCLTDRSPSGDEINHFARIVRDTGGRLWAARLRGTTTAHPIRTEVWYSDDVGGSWALSTTLTETSGRRLPIALLVHPTNQNIIALVSNSQFAPALGDDGVVLHYTLDRGANWVTNTPTVASGNNFVHTDNGASSRHMMLPSGRIVIANRESTSTHMKIYTSDNYGLTWQLRYTDTEVDEDNMLLFTQGQWLDSGNHLVGLRVPSSSGVAGAIAVMESVDAGTTWTVRTTGDPSDTQLGNDWDAVYDPVGDIIVAQNPKASPPWTNRILQLADASGTGTTWEDVTGDLPTPDIELHWEGIALIPTV